jgi:hypothetical protein
MQDAQRKEFAYESIRHGDPDNRMDEQRDCDLDGGRHLCWRSVDRPVQQIDQEIIVMRSGSIGNLNKSTVGAGGCLNSSNY